MCSYCADKKTHGWCFTKSEQKLGLKNVFSRITYTVGNFCVWSKCSTFCEIKRAEKGLTDL